MDFIRYGDKYPVGFQITINGENIAPLDEIIHKVKIKFGDTMYQYCYQYSDDQNTLHWDDENQRWYAQIDWTSQNINSWIDYIPIQGKVIYANEDEVNTDNIEIRLLRGLGNE